MQTTRLTREDKAVQGLLKWYNAHGRNFIWRGRGFPVYSLLIAEMMLQKTQAKVVEPVLKEFLARYPTVESVHKAPRKEIEKLIKRLGLFRGRSKNIKRVAKIIVKKHGGNVEAAMDKLAELPGVGSYVSSAVACFKGGKRVPAVDANVARVIGRLYGIDHRDSKRQNELLEKARKLLPRNNVKEFNWAMIDLGALVCKPSNPKHEECPLRPICYTGSMNYDFPVIEKKGGYKVELSNRGGLRKENPAPANLQKRDMKCLFTGCQEHTTNKSGLCTKHNKLFDDYKKRRKTKEFKNQPIERRNRLDDQWPGLIHSKDWLGRLITPGKTREDCLTDAPRHSDITEALVDWMKKDGSGRIKKMDAFIQDVLKRVVGNVPDATTLQENMDGRMRKVMTLDGLVRMTRKLVNRHFPKSKFSRTRVYFGRYKEREIKDLPIRVAAALLVLAYACEEANRGDFWFSRRHHSYKPRRGSAYMPSVYYFLRRHTNANKEQARMCLKS